MSKEIPPGTHCFMFTSDRAYELIDETRVEKRSILEGDELIVEKTEVCGWNTRIHFRLTKSERRWVPPSTSKDWSHDDGRYFFDFRNYLWNEAPSEVGYTIRPKV